MSIFSTQSVIPNPSVLLEPPAGSVLDADPVVPSANEVVEVPEQEIAVEASSCSKRAASSTAMMSRTGWPLKRWFGSGG